MTILILHGIGGHAGVHWQQWLHDELQADGHEVIMPNLPGSEHPDRIAWLDAVRVATKDIRLEELIIVAHSLGATAALDFIEGLSSPIEGLIAVSGFAKDYGAELNSYYLKEKAFDFSKVNKNLKWAEVFYGDNDPYVTQDSLYDLAKNLNVEPVVIKNGGHLNTESGYTKFPELLEIIKPK